MSAPTEQQQPEVQVGDVDPLCPSEGPICGEPHVAERWTWYCTRLPGHRPPHVAADVSRRVCVEPWL